MMSINADALSDGTAVYIANKGSQTLQLDGNEITSGKAVVINAFRYKQSAIIHVSTDQNGK